MGDLIEYIITTDRLPTKYPLGSIVTEKTCKAIKALVEQGEANRVTPHTRNVDVGVRTHKVICGWEDVASDRIRANLIADELDNFEIWKEDTGYKVTIYHKADEQHLRYNTGFKVMDICDYLWDEDKDILPFASKMDKIVVASEGLKNALKKKIVVPIVVIGDGHKISDKLNKYHRGEAKTVVWFGYSGNAHVLKPFLPFLKKHGLKLKVISQSQDGILDQADEFVKWDYFRCQEEIFNSEIALLPKNGIYKTNNKDVTAWLCGVPVAKTEADILKLINAKARNEQVKAVDFSLYDIKKRAKEYQKVCVELLGTK